MTEKIKIILLADDDPEDQELLEDIITRLEPSVDLRKVDSGKEAVDYLLSSDAADLPCLIILDYAMPVFNAAEVLDHISQELHLRSIPKVVWSSSKQPEHVKSCMDKGASSYFVKPNKMSELADIARKMLTYC